LLYSRQAREFTALAMRMGGFMIKLGQHYGSRVDILPREYTAELSKLQDSVTAEEPAAVLEAVELEFGRPVSSLYAHFEPTPLAAASLGQVHEARLKDGTKVAVKVLRPGIEALIQSDFGSLKTVLNLLDRFTPLGDMLDINEFYQDFRATISAELDYLQEGRNAEAFQENFLLNRHVEIPRIYWDLTTRRVLTMEYMDGVKIDDLDALDRAGIDRHELAVNLLELYVQMVLRDGFYHADPHSGNIFISHEEGHLGNILLLDFGMVGTLPTLAREGFGDFAQAFILKQPERMTQALLALGFIRADADLTVLNKALAPLLDRMLARRAGRREPLGAGLAEDLQELIYEQPFLLPGNVTFLGKALILTMSQCMRLDPQMDVLGEVTALVRGSRGADAVGGEADERAPSFLEAAGRALQDLLPALLNLAAAGEKMNKGELVVRLSRVQENRIMDRLTASTRGIVATIIGATLLISGVLLLPHATSAAAPIAAALLICLGLVIMLLQLRRPKPGKRRLHGHARR
jgi:predicted unusual protein kinase regulating ubiquinone biosynthesis (AarF/ABC1/UbiB family)